MHTSFQISVQKDRLETPKLKVQQRVVKTTQASTTGQKASGPITQKSYIVGPTNKSSLSDEILTLGA
jgi:hypothetical protein